MEMTEKEKKKTFWIPGCFVAFAVILVAMAGLYIYDKNLFPVWNFKLKPGVYRYVGKGGGEIIVSEDYVLKFQNFDLNKKVNGSYYNDDLNEIFLDKEQKFTLHQGFTGCYGLTCTLSGDYGEFLEVDYYPRDDKMELLTPNEDVSYIFLLEN